MAHTILGTTNDVTTCENCGRSNLKHTVILGVLDADGNVGGEIYVGTVCASKLSGKATKTITREASQADENTAKTAAKVARLSAILNDTTRLRKAWEATIDGFGPFISLDDFHSKLSADLAALK